LKIVGKIDRELIYSIDKDYEHILVRKRLQNFMFKEKETRLKKADWIGNLISVQPRQDVMQRDTGLYSESIKRRVTESL
jgi:hypothetical protein